MSEAEAMGTVSGNGAGQISCKIAPHNGEAPRGHKGNSRQHFAIGLISVVLSGSCERKTGVGGEAFGFG
jgi:hypothetical protein